MNKVIMDGYILPNSEKNPKMFQYIAGTDSKRSMLTFRLSVQRPFAKKDENGYYPTDIFTFRTWGATADFINNYFKPGDPIIVSGYNSVDQGGERDDGTRYPAFYYVRVEEAFFPLKSRNGGSSNGNGASDHKEDPKYPSTSPWEDEAPGKAPWEL